jgi:hypothetical protein
MLIWTFKPATQSKKKNQPLLCFNGHMNIWVFFELKMIIFNVQKRGNDVITEIDSII